MVSACCQEVNNIGANIQEPPLADRGNRAIESYRWYDSINHMNHVTLSVKNHNILLMFEKVKLEDKKMKHFSVTSFLMFDIETKFDPHIWR